MQVPIFFWLFILGAESIRQPSKSSKSRVAIASYSHGNDGTDEPVTFNHLPKAGGSFAKEVLWKSLRQDNLHAEMEHESVTPEDLADTFVIGMIRNPFDYYISMWCYHSENRYNAEGHPNWVVEGLTEEQQAECLGTAKPGHNWGDVADDIQKFRSFVRTMNDEKMGLLTNRFYFSYVSTPSWGPLQAITSTAKSILRKDSSMLDAIEHNFNATLNQICWVHTESLVKDLRSCLEQLELPSGRGSAVNWEKFDEAVAGSNHNPTNHASCSTFYDQDLMEFVSKADRHIFETFSGYVGQCV